MKGQAAMRQTFFNQSGMSKSAAEGGVTSGSSVQARKEGNVSKIENESIS